jgi:hypothetical protein
MTDDELLVVLGLLEDEGAGLRDRPRARGPAAGGQLAAAVVTPTRRNRAVRVTIQLILLVVASNTAF